MKETKDNYENNWKKKDIQFNKNKKPIITNQIYNKSKNKNDYKKCMNEKKKKKKRN